MRNQHAAGTTAAESSFELYRCLQRDENFSLFWNKSRHLSVFLETVFKAEQHRKSVHFNTLKYFLELSVALCNIKWLFKTRPNWTFSHLNESQSTALYLLWINDGFNLSKGLIWCVRVTCSPYLTTLESLQMMCSWNISLLSTLSISLRGTCRGRRRACVMAHYQSRQHICKEVTTLWSSTDWVQARYT